MNTIPTAILVFGYQTPVGPVPLGSGGEAYSLCETDPGLRERIREGTGLALDKLRSRKQGRVEVDIMYEKSALRRSQMRCIVHRT